MLGSIPKRKTAPPIAMLPVTCWPHLLAEQAEAERFRVSIGAGSLERDHRRREEGDQGPADAEHPAEDLAEDPALVLEQRPASAPTKAESAAQPQIWEKRLRETARPSATVASSPRKIMSAAAARPTLK